MPCEKYSQVEDTLLPLESRTFHSNQLANDANQHISQKQQSFRKESF
jgi:hypothetical protein